VVGSPGVDHNSGHPSNQPRYLTRNRLIAQALHRLILQLRLVLAGFMIKAGFCPVVGYTNATKDLPQKVFAVAVKTPFPGHQPLRNFSCIGIEASELVGDGNSASLIKEL
jgi:hypothetical protein